MKSLFGMLALLLFGCDGHTLDVGNDDSAAGGSNALPSSSAGESSDVDTWPVVTPICNNAKFDAANANWPDVTACAAAATGTQSDIVGIWDGYSLDEYFNPLKKYRLTLLAASVGGPICGTLRYGEGEVPPLSGDPTAWYPPLGSAYYRGYRPDEFSTTVLGMLDGFVYTIVKGGQFDNRLTFSVSSNELNRGWCGLQNAYSTYLSDAGGSFAYNCAPGGWDVFEGPAGGGPCVLRHGGTIVTLSPARCTLCNVFGQGSCVCDSCHCTALTTNTDKVSLTFSGDTATGTIERTLDGRVDDNPASLRFTRVKP